jgi:hypothetical protein
LNNYYSWSSSFPFENFAFDAFLENSTLDDTWKFQTRKFRESLVSWKFEKQKFTESFELMFIKLFI